MLGPDGDLVVGRLYNFPIIPLLLVGDQSSLDEDVVEEDIDDIIVTGVDLSGNSLAATDDVLCVQRQSCLAAPTFCLRLLLGDQLLPFPNTGDSPVFP